MNLEWKPPEENRGNILGYDIGYQSGKLLLLLWFCVFHTGEKDLALIKFVSEVFSQVARVHVRTVLIKPSFLHSSRSSNEWTELWMGNSTTFDLLCRVCVCVWVCMCVGVRACVCV